MCHISTQHLSRAFNLIALWSNSRLPIVIPRASRPRQTNPNLIVKMLSRTTAGHRIRLPSSNVSPPAMLPSINQPTPYIPRTLMIISTMGGMELGDWGGKTTGGKDPLSSSHKNSWVKREEERRGREKAESSRWT
jgi:hypothetical protein